MNYNQFTQICFSRRGSKIPESVQTVLTSINEYFKNKSSTRLRSARILNKKIKVEVRYDYDDDIDEKRKKRNAPVEDESVDKKEVLEQQKASRAERAARRSMFTYPLSDNSKESSVVNDIKPSVDSTKPVGNIKFESTTPVNSDKKLDSKIIVSIMINYKLCYNEIIFRILLIRF